MKYVKILSNVIKHDMKTVNRSLNNRYMDGPAWYALAVNKLTDAIDNGLSDKISFKADEISDFGAKIIVVIDGKEIPLTKKKIRMRDINTIFGGGIASKPGKSGKIVPTNYSHKVSHNDISKVKPKHSAGYGEIVKLANGQLWEYKGISGYDIDNKNRINGWERIK